MTEERQIMEVSLRQGRVQQAAGDLVACMVNMGWLIETDQIVSAIKEVRASLERLDGEIGSTVHLLYAMIRSGKFTLREVLDSIVPIGAALNKKEE